MADIAPMYMTINVSKTDVSKDLSIWISPTRPDNWERRFYPINYVWASNFGQWFIRSNEKLSDSEFRMCAEYADDMCAATQKRNAVRKLANR